MLLSRGKHQAIYIYDKNKLISNQLGSSYLGIDISRLISMFGLVPDLHQPRIITRSFAETLLNFPTPRSSGEHYEKRGGKQEIEPISLRANSSLISTRKQRSSYYLRFLICPSGVGVSLYSNLRAIRQFKREHHRLAFFSQKKGGSLLNVEIYQRE